MKGSEFFELVNSRLDAVHSDPSDVSSAVRSTFSELFDELKTSFTTSEESLEHGDCLVCFEGAVVDIFDTEIETVRVVDSAQKSNWAVFNHLGPSERFVGKEVGQIADSMTFLLLLNVQNEQLARDTWKEISALAPSCLNNPQGFPLLVTIYNDFETIKLGQRLTVWGFLVKTLAVDEPKTETSFKDFHDYYPLHLVPKLCCLRFAVGASPRSVSHNFKALPLLSSALRNVSGSAEFTSFFLAGLLTSNQTRRNQLNVDFLSVNFFNASQQGIDGLALLLGRFGLRPQTVRVDEEGLNEDLFATKNHEFNVLRLGKLFVGLEEPVLLNELGLQESKLSEKATLNVMRLNELVQTQRVFVAFFEQNFVPFELPCPLFCFSGQKSVLRFELRIDAGGAVFDEQLATLLPQLPTEHAHQLRAEVDEARRRVGEIAFSDAMKDYLQNSFVERRRENPQGRYTPAVFQQTIKLAKHLAVLHGKVEMTQDCYLEAVSLMDHAVTNQ